MPWRRELTRLRPQLLTSPSRSSKSECECNRVFVLKAPVALWFVESLTEWAPRLDTQFTAKILHTLCKCRLKGAASAHMFIISFCCSGPKQDVGLSKGFYCHISMHGCACRSEKDMELRGEGKRSNAQVLKPDMWVALVYLTCLHLSWGQ